MKIVLACGLCLALACFAWPAPETPPPATPAARIVGTSRVIVREAPSTSAGIVARLSLGTAVTELERTSDPVTIGSQTAPWVRVQTADGQTGWVFGAFLRPDEPQRRLGLRQDLLRERRAGLGQANFFDASELAAFAAALAGELTDRPDRAEAELVELLAVRQAAGAIPFNQADRAPYAEWIAREKPRLVYGEPQGQWLLAADSLWALAARYKDLPLGELAAWEAATTMSPGECEGWLDCYLPHLNATLGRYLRLYPAGAHTDAALGQVAEYLKSLLGDTPDGTPMFSVEVPGDCLAELQRLRETVSSCQSSAVKEVLKLLDAIGRHLKK